MQRLLDLRITKWYLKLAYIAGVWVVGYVVIALLGAVRAPSLVGSVIDTVITLAGFIFGARLFGGKDEPVAPRRPWWQMTARPILSRSLGIIFFVCTGSMIVLVITAALGIETALRSMKGLTLGDVASSGILFAALAFLYLNSAARLPKTPQPSRQPTFKTKVKLD